MKTVIKKGTIINEGKSFVADILIENDRISRIDDNIAEDGAVEINAEGSFVMPGIIDDQVHFREPGMPHKASIYTEARAAVAGGVTSFMEMPNTKPTATTQERLQDKYDIAKKWSLANYSFYMGATNDNLEEVLKTQATEVCGIKIFMGSSTGNMLVDNKATLEGIFSNTPMLIATHCEDEATIRKNMKDFEEKYGDDLNATHHPLIRSVEGCYLSSSMAKTLAEKHGSRLHILHISTAKELELFRNDIPLKDKKVTAEVCVHHLHFDASQYASLGNKIKCNPAIKEASNKEALFAALLDDRLDVIATDHAPHTIEEKARHYTKAPSGLPLVQHSLNIMFQFYKEGRISMEKIVEKMCHAPAILFNVKERGYLREGYKADIVILNPKDAYMVSKENIHYRCGWSPLERKTFDSKVTHTFISGHLAYSSEGFNENVKGQRMKFEKV